MTEAPFDERRKFAIGDRVRPTAKHRGDATLPMGKVVAVFRLGAGQKLYIEGWKRPHLAGFFELEPK